MAKNVTAANAVQPVRRPGRLLNAADRHAGSYYDSSGSYHNMQHPQVQESIRQHGHLPQVVNPQQFGAVQHGDGRNCRMCSDVRESQMNGLDTIRTVSAQRVKKQGMSARDRVAGLIRGPKDPRYVPLGNGYS